jgi:hypothetical protein
MAAGWLLMESCVHTLAARRKLTRAGGSAPSALTILQSAVALTGDIRGVLRRIGFA